MLGRKTRSDKKVRINPSFSQDTHERIKMMALACNGITKTKMVELIVEMALNDSRSVENIQQQLDALNSQFKVVATKIGNQTFLRHENYIL